MVASWEVDGGVASARGFRFRCWQVVYLPYLSGAVEETYGNKYQIYAWPVTAGASRSKVSPC